MSINTTFTTNNANAPTTNNANAPTTNNANAPTTSNAIAPTMVLPSVVTINDTALTMVLPNLVTVDAIAPTMVLPNVVTVRKSPYENISHMSDDEISLDNCISALAGVHLSSNRSSYPDEDSPIFNVLNSLESESEEDYEEFFPKSDPDPTETLLPQVETESEAPETFDEIPGNDGPEVQNDQEVNAESEEGAHHNEVSHVINPEVQNNVQENAVIPFAEIITHLANVDLNVPILNLNPASNDQVIPSQIVRKKRSDNPDAETSKRRKF